jgi:hypothetical protein
MSLGRTSEGSWSTCARQSSPTSAKARATNSSSETSDEAFRPSGRATAYVIMLADPLSRFVSGATIAVTGGKPTLQRCCAAERIAP